MFTPLLAQIAAPVPHAAASTSPADPLLKIRADFISFQWSRFTSKEWLHIAEYYGVRVLFVLVLMTLAWTLSSWTSNAVRRALTRVKFDETLSIFIAKFVRWGILLLVALMCLSKFGVETAGLAAVLGAMGFAIGLAFQGTLSNFAAGAMLLIFRPYKVGDEVNVAGYTGKVYEIELFTTAIDTADNRRVIIPNSSIFGSVIENISEHAVRRIQVDVGTVYSADVDETRRVLERAVRSVPQIVAEPAPAVILNNLGLSSVDWQVRGWAKREQIGDARQAVLRAVKIELDRAGIGIPFPQMELHVNGLGEPNRRAA